MRKLADSGSSRNLKQSYLNLSVPDNGLDIFNSLFLSGPTRHVQKRKRSML